jgi:hypothetical protein
MAILACPSNQGWVIVSLPISLPSIITIASCTADKATADNASQFQEEAGEPSGIEFTSYS